MRPRPFPLIKRTNYANFDLEKLVYRVCSSHKEQRTGLTCTFKNVYGIFFYGKPYRGLLADVIFNVSELPSYSGLAWIIYATRIHCSCINLILDE